jgi:hypothetical protein
VCPAYKCVVNRLSLHTANKISSTNAWYANEGGFNLLSGSTTKEVMFKLRVQKREDFRTLLKCYCTSEVQMVMRPRKLIVSRFRHTWTSGAIMLECWPTLATIALIPPTNVLSGWKRLGIFWIAGFFFLFLCFSRKIKLISVKFLCDSHEIPAFQSTILLYIIS